MMLVLQRCLLGFFEDFYRLGKGVLCLSDPIFSEASPLLMLSIELVLHYGFIEAFTSNRGASFCIALTEPFVRVVLLLSR